MGTYVLLSVLWVVWVSGFITPEPYRVDWTCDEIWHKYGSLPAISRGEVTEEPPKDVPADMAAEYTMGRTIPVGKFYVDDTNGTHGTRYTWGKGAIENLIKEARTVLSLPVARLHKMKPNERLFVQAVKKNTKAIAGAHVVVFGSMEPWYEALAIAAGASKVTTVEYNSLSYEHELIETHTPRSLWEQWNASETGPELFDVAFSVSSFDHDGLGRYGDPLVPDGDLKASRMAQCVVKPKGLFLFTVPIGPDILVWNLHRRYGQTRLPHLIAGWEIVDVVGWVEHKLYNDANFRQSYEPVMVLRNPEPPQVPEETPAEYESEAVEEQQQHAGEEL